MTTSTKLSGSALAPRPPAKGSFPLDHLSECKSFALAYERCLSANQKLTNKCRKEARAYLECRMERGLMAREEWNKLGMSKIDDNAGSFSESTQDDVGSGHSESSKAEVEDSRRKADKRTVANRS